MKKLLLVSMVFGMLAVVAPAAHAAGVEQAAVGAWACGLDGQKCFANIPSFPSPLALTPITSGGGSLTEAEVAVVTGDPGRVLPLGSEVSKEAITNIGGSYLDPACAAGAANGTLTLGDGDTYTFAYVRVGATAVIVAVQLAEGGAEVLAGALAFDPKTDPVNLALRCAGMANGPLTVNFIGGGIGVEVAPGSDVPPPII